MEKRDDSPPILTFLKTRTPFKVGVMTMRIDGGK